MVCRSTGAIIKRESSSRCLLLSIFAHALLRDQTPDSVLDGWPEEFDDVTEEIYADFNKKHGTSFKFPVEEIVAAIWHRR
jgi:hypothetical protein